MSAKSTKPTPDVKFDEQGSVILTLPFSKVSVSLRRPKGRDMEAIELRAKQSETNTGILMTALSVLSGLSLEELQDLDAEDLEALGEALSHFPVFARLVTER